MGATLMLVSALVAIVTVGGLLAGAASLDIDDIMPGAHAQCYTC
jgi:hypothetical protein